MKSIRQILKDISSRTNSIPSSFISKPSFLFNPFNYQVFIKSYLIIFRLLTSFDPHIAHTNSFLAHTNSFLYNTLEIQKKRIRLHFLEGINRLILVINFIISLKNSYNERFANNLCNFINYQVYKVGLIIL